MGIVTWGFGWYGFTLARSREEPPGAAPARRGAFPRQGVRPGALRHGEVVDVHRPTGLAQLL